MNAPGNGFGVDLEALGQAEKGVRDAVAELNEMAGGGIAGEADGGADGRGLMDFLISEDLSAESVGHGELAAALVSFVDRWEWGVKFLVEDGHDAADALRDTRSTYEKAEDAAATAIKRVAHIAAGNPLEDATAWDDKNAEQLWGELAPDYSAESAVQAGENVVRQTEGVTGLEIDGRTGGGA
ncbi:MAG: hypothetical protein IJH84_18440 [Saccharopolyspora sp.]|uniref:hypothetical protein n=1 Tax=Saccharopolyspora sp. TaxID=33915 RepID=UPI0025CFFF64|nr:hypothetical protein [Saccharopolyspora sp.]MBQ6642996.1 hypothetical protein [Saccharopolyspora sp.]